MIKIAFNATKTKVYWAGMLFTIVLFLCCGCFYISPYLSATCVPRLVSYGTEAAAQTELRGQLVGEDWMVFQRVNLRFEQLEARHLMSASSPAPPVLEHTLTAPLLELMDAPPPLASNSTPMVYAGETLTVSQADSATLNGEARANWPNNNMSVTWSQVSGPGTVNITDPGSIITTATFSSSGTYELALTADNNGESASDRVIVNVTAANVVNIDQAWLDQQESGPYYLDQANTTYVLQTDVTTEGSAFAIIANDVIFDLNGHTITYGNADPITVFNGSFEAGVGSVADGWDFSNAPNAERFDATGRWIYNEVYDGDYSLRFNDTTADEYVESTGTITLQPNTTYTLSGMFEYGGEGRAVNNGEEGYPLVKGYAQLLSASNEVVAEASFAFTNNRGIQLVEAEFTTGDDPNIYTVRVGVEGDPLGADPFYIDDIKVQRTKNYGVATQVYSWATSQYVDGFTQYGVGTNSTVKNGTITQGNANGSWSHAIFMQQIDGLTIDDLTVTVQGQNTSAIYGLTQENYHQTITNNTFTSNVKTVSSRDAGDGSVINNVRGEIGYNEIVDGPHIGILSGGDDTEIHHNTIATSGIYTNAFAIALNSDRGEIGAGGAAVHNNTINNYTNGKYGRGMIMSGSNPVAIYDNNISVHVNDQNQEYEGAPIGGAYGIQIENGSNKEVYGNTVAAYSDVAEAFALRIGGGAIAPEHNYIHDNTFEAVRLSGTKTASTLRIDLLNNGSDTRFVNNTFRSNDSFSSHADNIDIVLESSTFQATGNLATFAVIRSINVGPTVIEFRDPVFADQATEDAFANGEVRKTTGQVDPLSSYAVSWTTTFQVNDEQGQPIAGAAVTVVDKNGIEVFSGTTDANGSSVATLKQFATAGDVKTEYGPYTVQALADSSESTLNFEADSTQTLVLQVAPSVGSNSLSTPADQQYGLQNETLWFVISLPIQQQSTRMDVAIESSGDVEYLAPNATIYHSLGFNKSTLDEGWEVSMANTPEKEEDQTDELLGQESETESDIWTLL